MIQTVNLNSISEQFQQKRQEFGCESGISRNETPQGPTVQIGSESGVTPNETPTGCEQQIGGQTNTASVTAGYENKQDKFESTDAHDVTVEATVDICDKDVDACVEDVKVIVKGTDRLVCGIKGCTKDFGSRAALHTHRKNKHTEEERAPLKAGRPKVVDSEKVIKRKNQQKLAANQYFKEKGKARRQESRQRSREFAHGMQDNKFEKGRRLNHPLNFTRPEMEAVLYHIDTVLEQCKESMKFIKDSQEAFLILDDESMNRKVFPELRALCINAPIYARSLFKRQLKELWEKQQHTEDLIFYPKFKVNFKLSSKEDSNLELTPNSSKKDDLTLAEDSDELEERIGFIRKVCHVLCKPKTDYYDVIQSFSQKVRDVIEKDGRRFLTPNQLILCKKRTLAERTNQETETGISSQKRRVTKLENKKTNEVPTHEVVNHQPIQTSNVKKSVTWWDAQPQPKTEPEPKPEPKLEPTKESKLNKASVLYQEFLEKQCKEAYAQRKGAAQIWDYELFAAVWKEDQKRITSKPFLDMLYEDEDRQGLHDKLRKVAAYLNQVLTYRNNQVIPILGIGDNICDKMRTQSKQFGQFYSNGDLKQCVLKIAELVPNFIEIRDLPGKGRGVKRKLPQLHMNQVNQILEEKILQDQLDNKNIKPSMQTKTIGQILRAPDLLTLAVEMAREKMIQNHYETTMGRL